MTFETELEGMSVRVEIPRDGRPYSVRVTGTGGFAGAMGDVPGELVDKFASVDQAVAAIKKYNLSLRKGFTNSSAWNRRGEQVEITSICEDGAWCWIRRSDGVREKVGIKSLYEDRDEVSEAIAYEEQADRDVKERWNSIRKWEPRWDMREGGK